MKSAGWNMTTVCSLTAAGASIHLSLFASNLGIQSTHLTIYSTMASPLAVIDPEFLAPFLPLLTGIQFKEIFYQK
jgi:hypothetical protein